MASASSGVDGTIAADGGSSLPYLPDIPQANDYISLSQLQMLGNNHTINQAWGLEPVQNRNVGDHVPLETGAEAQLGRHKKTTLRSQGSDPTTGTDELALYSKQISNLTEIVYRDPSNGTVNQLTSNGTLFDGIALSAYVIFDGNGNILKASRPDSQGNLVDTPMSYNVSSVTKTAGVDSYTITYSRALSDNNYFWCFGLTTVGTPSSGRFVAPTANATYANSVSTTFIKVSTYKAFDSGIATGDTSRITLQIYTRP